LRDMYAAADYSTAFLEAAIRKAGIQVSILDPPTADTPTKMHPVTTVEDLVDAGRRLDMASMPPPRLHTLTSLADPSARLCGFHSAGDHVTPVTDEEVARRLESFLATSPPASDHTSETAGGEVAHHGRSGSGSCASTRSFDTVSLAATGTTLMDGASSLGGD